MSRTIDAIWRSRVAHQLQSKIADRELDECADLLKRCISDLQRTANGKLWQDHYEVALTVCRLSRTARFGFVEPESFDPDTKSEILRLLTEAWRAIRPDDEAPGIVYRLKSLDEIRRNIDYRIGRIADEADQPLFDSEMDNSAGADADEQAPSD